MVQFFGRTVSSQVEDDRFIAVFDIPAFRQGLAERRARRNAEGKGFDNVRVEETEVLEQGDIPRQKIFRIRVSAPR